MKAKVTNAWSVVAGAAETGRPGRTRIVIESTAPPAGCRLSRPFPTRWTLELGGLSLNMPAGSLSVRDGLVSEFLLAEAAPDRVRIDVFLEHPTEARVEIRDGLPVRTVLHLDRAPVQRILGGRIVAIDPGHGGADVGARGPVNLIEKDVVLQIAKRLAAWLAASGARPVLVRTDDEDVPARERVRRAADAGAECLVSLHTGHATRREVAGTRALFPPGSPEGRALAECLHRGVVGRIGRPDRGVVGDERALPGPFPCPAARVEVVCIANPLEEGWLRSPVFKDRAAQGLCNGLQDYFARRAGFPTERRPAGAAKEGRPRPAPAAPAGWAALHA